MGSSLWAIPGHYLGISWAGNVPEDISGCRSAQKLNSVEQFLTAFGVMIETPDTSHSETGAGKEFDFSDKNHSLHLPGACSRAPEIRHVLSITKCN